ncbi:MAG: extracellular solute-binding protein [Spirochaetales bacterium]|nr:extracellular solute-binding protein [Spirochaetales bacterium]
MKKNIVNVLTLALVALAALFGAAGCKKGDGKTLYLYNWAVYTPDSVIKQFEEEFGVKVVYDDFASNEDMYAKLKAGGSGYDLIVPSGDYVSIMKEQGMLEKIDLSKIPNAKYLKKETLEKATYDQAMEYSVPYYMGAAGIAVNKEKVPNFEESWSIFARKDLAGRMSMLDDMREVLGDALAYLGYSVNTTNQAELDQALALVNNEWKPNLVKFDAEGFGKSFAAGEFWVVQGYAEVVYGEIPPEKYDTVAFFIPKDEGGPMYIDSLCIPKGARNPELAHEFINFILRPEIYAEFLDSFGFPSTIHTEAGALQKVQPYYSAESLANCELKEDLGADLELYNQIWQKIRFTE